MESLQHLKSRLNSVRNIGKITKAMEVVAATKMRRSQEIALNSRHYALKSLEILQKIAKNSPIKNSLTVSRPVKNTLLVVVSSDRGLAGSFNTQVFRAVEMFLASDVPARDSSHKYVFAAVGKKSLGYAAKKKFEVAGSFQKFGDFIEPEETEPLAVLVINGFNEEKWDRVVVISTHFRTTLKQETLIRQVLPVDFEKIKETVAEIVPVHGRYSETEAARESSLNEKVEYIFEPSPVETVNFLIPQLVKTQIYHLILEANASEHSARMVAMKSASDNADDLSQKLLLGYNKVRQANITNELIEITSTQNALI